MLRVGMGNIAKLVTRIVRISALKYEEREGTGSPTWSMHFCSRPEWAARSLTPLTISVCNGNMRSVLFCLESTT